MEGLVRVSIRLWSHHDGENIRESGNRAGAFFAYRMRQQMVISANRRRFS